MASEYSPDQCGHGRKWTEECQDCHSVWREERIKDLYAQADRYGFRLVPKEENNGE